MPIEATDVFTIILISVPGLIGLFLASGAHDDAMYLFGLSLAGFAVVFVFGAVRRHYDPIDAARAAARVRIHD